MRIGVLLCDDVRPELQLRHGNYPEMFSKLFAQVDPTITLVFYRVTDEQYPSQLTECDGYLTSGSRFSVYDDQRWIRVFQGFIQQLYSQRCPLVGICFGHQMIAWALGGNVTPASTGWGLGVQHAELYQAAALEHSWLTNPRRQIALLSSHQDQISQLPSDSQVLAGSTFCPYAMCLTGKHFLGIQGHPEFTPAYLEDLIRLRAPQLPEPTIRTALRSLSSPTQHLLITRWIIQFIKHYRFQVHRTDDHHQRT